MLALSIRQPFAELILRGIKTVEYRSRATRIIGQRFWIYAARKKGWGFDEFNRAAAGGRWSVKQADNIVVPGDLPAWMLELAEQVGMIEPEATLPTGVIVGSAVIEKVVSPLPARPDGVFHWHLADVQRITTLRKPKRHPQPVWFQPF
jgi:hypothetical protein